MHFSQIPCPWNRGSYAKIKWKLIVHRIVFVLGWRDRDVFVPMLKIILSFKDFMQMRSTVDFIMNSVNPKPNCLENFVIPCLLYFIVLVEMITKTHLKKHVESKTICVDWLVSVFVNLVEWSRLQLITNHHKPFMQHGRSM